MALHKSSAGPKSAPGLLAVAQACKTQRTTNPSAFAAKFGTKRNALAKCVKAKLSVGTKTAKHKGKHH
jgi:hypothetical protein